MKQLFYFTLLFSVTLWGCMEKANEVGPTNLEYIEVPFSLDGGGSVEIVSGGRVADDPAMILNEFFTDSLYFRFYTNDGLVDENISILKTESVITLPRVEGNIALSNYPYNENGNIAEYTHYPIPIAPDRWALRDSILFSNLSFVLGTSDLLFDLTRLDGKLTIKLNSDIALDVSINIENAFGFDYIFDGSNGGEPGWSDNGEYFSLADFVVVYGDDILPPPWYFDRDIFDPASPSYNSNGGEAFYPAWRASPGDLTIKLYGDYGDVFTWTNSKEVFFPGVAKEMIVNINYNSGAGQDPTANISIEGDVSSFTEEVQTIEFGNSFCFAKYDEASLIANDWLFSRVPVPENSTPDKFVSYTEANAANYFSGGPITTELGTGYNYGSASPPISMTANDEINVQFESLNVGTYEDPIVYSVALWNTATDVYSSPIEVQSLSGIEILTTYAEFDGTYRIVAFAKLTGVSDNQVAFTDFCLNKSPGTIFSADFENDTDANKFPYQYTHTTGSTADPAPSNFTPNSILNSTSTSGAVDDQLTDGDSFAWQFSNIPYTANQSYTKVIATNPMSLKAGDQISALFMQMISSLSKVNHRIYLWDTSDNSAFAHEAVSTPVQTGNGSYILQTTVPTDGNYILVLASTAYSSNTVIAGVDDILITRQ